MNKAFAALLATVLLAGCAASGVQVSKDAALQFKEGVTTEAEILEKMGRPTTIMLSGNTKVIAYSGMQYQVKGATFIPIVGAFAGGSDFNLTSVTYEIDPNGVLKKATYAQSSGGNRMGTTPVEMSPTEPRAVK